MEAEEHFTNRLLADIHISSNFMLLFMQYKIQSGHNFINAPKAELPYMWKLVTIFGFLDPAK